MINTITFKLLEYSDSSLMYRGFNMGHVKAFIH